jgi:hypothetical protein
MACLRAARPGTSARRSVPTACLWRAYGVPITLLTCLFAPQAQ